MMLEINSQCKSVIFLITGTFNFHFNIIYLIINIYTKYVPKN